MTTFDHTPVLLHEAVACLEVKPGKLYIDATAGGGGHTQEILNHGGKVLAIDQDSDAITHLEKRFYKESRVTVTQGNFEDIKKIAKKHGFKNAAGVLFDLGMSSHQIDTSGRGFSFRYDEPLDMRMDATQELTAREIVNSWHEHELVEVLMKYGEEGNAHAIARAIVEARKEKKIEKTRELVEVVESVTPRTGKLHPATKTFQALRIMVNHELDSLKDALAGAFETLDHSGRLVVISFHSLEDRIVKNYFRSLQEMHKCVLVNKKPILPSVKEIENNIRARSAKMRVVEKI